MTTVKTSQVQKQLQYYGMIMAKKMDEEIIERNIFYAIFTVPIRFTFEGEVIFEGEICS